MEVIFKIARETGDQTYQLDLAGGNTILDGLNQIKWYQDGSLAFRKNCRNTICGSCSMVINGRSTLACKENIKAEAIIAQQISPNQIPMITIEPMKNFPIIKDLVVDMTKFWDNLEQIEPYVSTSARNIPEREFLVSPQERAKLDESGNCILCGACYSECNAVEVNPQFAGPHALAKAYRMVADSRDDQSEERLQKYNDSALGVWGCTRCLMCNTVCPMGVQPLDQITKIKQKILKRTNQNTSRSIRHRKILIKLVKSGGWIDERRFAIFVVGNYLRDLKGLLTLLPLGARMLIKRKLPLTFEPSKGASEVCSLIESVQKQL